MRRRFAHRPKANEEMALQITSMADIFTILLVFLLKSYSTGITSITPSQHVMLPQARSSDDMQEALKLEIGPTVILLDDEPVTTLSNFQFDRTDVEVNGTSRSLNSALIRKTKDTAITSGPLIVLADQKTPYAVFRSVMDAAENYGFKSFKLVVVEDN